MATASHQPPLIGTYEKWSDVPFKVTYQRLHLNVYRGTWEGPDGCIVEAAQKRIPVEPDGEGRPGQEDGQNTAEDDKRRARRRATREASLLRRARHGHVVGVLETYFEPEGPNRAPCFCIIMPFAEATLSDYVLQGPQAPAIKTQWFGCLMGAVAHIHELGIWHRDIKPSNILVQGQTRILLADFGLSTVVWPDAAARDTTDEMLSGTPGYYAPEVEARTSTGGLPADIFALGIVFVEMVAAAVGDKDQHDKLMTCMKAPLPAADEPGHTPKRDLKAVHDVIHNLQRALVSRAAQRQRGISGESGSDLAEATLSEPQPDSDSEPSTAHITINDLGILNVCRDMVDEQPHMRPTANDLRQWWRHELRQWWRHELRSRPTDAVRRECDCTCNKLALDDGGGGDGGTDSSGSGGWPYLHVEEPTGAKLKKAYDSGHRLVARALKNLGARMGDDEALVAAARGGLWDLVQNMADERHERKVDHRDDAGRTALHYLAGAGEVDCDVWNSVVDTLLDRKANIMATDSKGRTPLRMAAERGSADRIWRLVRPRAAQKYGGAAGRQGGAGGSGGDKTASAGDMLVRLLCENRGGVPGIDDHLAASYRDEIEAGLLQCSSSPEGRAAGADAYGEISSEEPVQLCQLFAAESHGLIEARDVNSDQTPLSIAAMNGHEAIVRLLLDQGADSKAMDRLGHNPLSKAAAYGHARVVRLLLDSHAAETVDKAEFQEAVGATDDKGETPLFKAAKRGHLAVVKLLLDYGADATTPNKSGDTALVRASAGGHGSIVRLLLDDAAASAGGIPAILATIRKAKDEAERGGHWRTAQILEKYSSQDRRPPKPSDPDVGPTLMVRVLALWKSCVMWAAHVLMFFGSGIGALAWVTVMVASLVAVDIVGESGLRPYLVLPYYRSVSIIDRFLGWNVAIDNQIGVPSPAA